MAIIQTSSIKNLQKFSVYAELLEHKMIKLYLLAFLRSFMPLCTFSYCNVQGGWGTAAMLQPHLRVLGCG